MKKDNEIIAHNVSLLREMEQLTQKEFAQKYGVHQRSICAYEKGLNRPKGDFLLKLAKNAGVAPETLLTVSLRADRQGKLVNLKSSEQVAQELRIKLQKVMTELNDAMQKFYKGLSEINGELARFEKKKSA